MEEGKQVWTTIYLDCDEEINNIISKVKNCPGVKIALVLHENSKVLNQETNFKLLKFYLSKENKETVIVSSDQAVRQLGEKLGIEVISALQEVAASLEEETTSLAKKKTNKGKEIFPIYWVGNRKVVLSICFLVMSLVILGITYLNLPWTTVEIIPATKTLEEDLPLQISSHYQEMDLAKKLLPAVEKQEQLLLSNDFAATGIKIIGKTKSKGSVVIINEGSQAVFLPAGTSLSTLSGVNFITVKDTSVPKRRVEMFMGVPVGLIAGKTEVAVEAKQPGSSGNVHSGEISRIVSNNTKLRVINPGLTTGGEDERIKVVTVEDLARAEAGIKERLMQNINVKLGQDVGKENILLDKSLSIKQLEVGYNKKVGEVGERFTVKGQIKATALVIPKVSLQKISNYWLKKSLVPGYSLRNTDARVVSWQGELVAPGKYNLEVHIIGSLRARINAEKIKEQIKGMRVQDAEAKLTAMPEIGHFHIENGGRTVLNNFFLKIKIKSPLSSE